VFSALSVRLLLLVHRGLCLCRMASLRRVSLRIPVTARVLHIKVLDVQRLIVVGETCRVVVGRRNPCVVNGRGSCGIVGRSLIIASSREPCVVDCSGISRVAAACCWDPCVVGGHSSCRVVGGSPIIAGCSPITTSSTCSSNANQLCPYLRLLSLQLVLGDRESHL
jgi:hypothetical protein